MTKRTKFILLSPLFLAGFLLFVALGGEVVKWLWNWLLPPLFGFPQVTFWQALGLLALCRILFGGLGCHRGSSSHYRRRWEHMTPEERERVRQRMRERWSGGPSTASGGEDGGSLARSNPA
jgi:hypothetical protein